jgi:hypothetical protein
MLREPVAVHYKPVKEMWLVLLDRSVKCGPTFADGNNFNLTLPKIANALKQAICKSSNHFGYGGLI